MSEYWLPDDFVLRLTALEAGALSAHLSRTREQARIGFMVNVQGREEPVEMIDRIIEKVELAYREWKSKQPA